MKIIIDFSNQQSGGGIQVAISFINDLVMMDTSDEFIMFLSPQVAESLKKTELPKNFQAVEIPKEYYKNIIIRGREIKKLEDKFKPNIIFTLFGPSYHKSKYPKIVGFAVGQLLYPKSPYFKKINFTSLVKIKIILNLKKFFFQKNSDALIFETEDARRIFTRMTKGKIDSFTVSNTLNELFYKPEKWLKRNFNIKNTFNILYLTANYPHKNLDIIPIIINHIINKTSIRNFKFILSIDKEDVKFSSKYDNYIEYIGKVSIEEVPSLYEQVDMLFMPTLLEIFSASYLEAMYMKKPIIASDLSFARDICGDAALFCSPLSSCEYAAAIINLYNDEELRKNLQEKGILNLKRFGNSKERTKSYLKILREYRANENSK